MRKFFRTLSARSLAFFRSIRFRLMLWSELILGVVLLLFSGFVYFSQQRELRTAALDRLMFKSEQLETLSRFNGMGASGDDATPSGGGSTPNGSGPIPFAGQTPQGVATLQEGEALVVLDAQARVIQQLGPLQGSDLSQLIAAGVKLIMENGFRPVSLEGQFAIQGTNSVTHQDYLFVMRLLPFQGAVGGWIILGRPLDPFGQLPRLIVTLILASLAMLFVAAVGGYWLANRAMHPVQIITRAAREISESDLSRRLNLKTQDELGELANTFDQMLARLQAAFERQRQFTADASHELRTPLTIVSLEASHALENRRSVQEYERALGVIQSENEFMAGLVNDLLTLARMDAGQTVLKMEELDLSDVALEAVERLMPLASRKKIELTTGDLPELLVKGDRQVLFQMVTNLVENAIKYSLRSQPSIRVETGRLETQAWVRVEDNGPGIAPEHLPHLFERFYRVDSARTRNTPAPPEATASPEPPASLEATASSDAGWNSPASTGSGLGLSIVQWIAQVHGGQVQVHSQLGQGSVFEVSLPLLEANGG